MNSKLIVVALVFVVSGCQVSVRLGADGTFVPHTHEPIAAPASAPTTAEVVTKAETTSAPVCPSAPVVAECPTAQPVVKAASETQTNAAPANPPEANSVAAESQNTQPQEAQAQNTQPQKQSSEPPPQSEPPANSDVAVDEKASVPAETFDIEKYVEQSASCVQQRPCIRTQAEESSPPNVVNEPKKTEPAKVIEQAKPADSVINRKAVNVESGGIQRVDRKRALPVRVEVPPDMPR
jgi:hypothetical protein